MPSACRLSQTLGVVASWPSCMNRFASSSQQVRTHRPAVAPCQADRASARSAPVVRRALCPFAFAFGVRNWFLSPTISQANLVCRASPARQVLSVSRHHVSPTLPSSGLPNGSRSRQTLGVAASWPPCMNGLASSSSQVRRHRAAATPWRAAHASARSDPFVCRALCPLAFAFGVPTWLLSPTISQANLVCWVRPARQALSVSHHHVSPTLPSSGLPKGSRSRLTLGLIG